MTPMVAFFWVIFGFLQLSKSLAGSFSPYLDSENGFRAPQYGFREDFTGRVLELIRAKLGMMEGRMDLNMRYLKAEIRREINLKFRQSKRPRNGRSDLSLLEDAQSELRAVQMDVKQTALTVRNVQDFTDVVVRNQTAEFMSNAEPVALTLNIATSDIMILTSKMANVEERIDEIVSAPRPSTQEATTYKPTTEVTTTKRTTVRQVYSTSATEKVCKDGYTLFPAKEFCYKYFGELTRTWMDARNLCRRDNTDLLMVKDQETRKYFSVVIEEQIGSPAWFWIGANDIMIEGQWEWVDGTPVALDRFWNSGEPNDASGEDCAYMTHKPHTDYYVFNDNPCTITSHVICTDQR